jgi:hypothetical protein
MDNDEATFWLSQFIGKNLRVHASDGRVFGGQMKCTDKVSQSAICFLHFSVIEHISIQEPYSHVFWKSCRRWMFMKTTRSMAVVHCSTLSHAWQFPNVISKQTATCNSITYESLINISQDRNIILALAHEYRAPSAEIIRKAIQDSGNPSTSVPWNSRFVGLVVVPGQHITKIEFEESTLPGQRNPIAL